MQPRILLVTYPAQGHINPSLQLAKLLIRAGAHVTFLTSSSASTHMSKPPAMPGLEFATFSDGYDHGFNHGTDDIETYMSELDRLGSQALTELIMARADDGHPFACLLYGILIPWAAEIAQSLHLPSVLVWSQPATVFDIYYYYFNGSELVGNRDLQGLPSLSVNDLPSFLVPSKSNSHNFILKLYHKHIKQLDRETNPKVLINSFDSLELEALRAIKKFKLMGIGPLLPSAFLDGKDPSDTSFGCDLFRGSKDYYIQWLNSNPQSSVIYVSFGSISVLSKQQSEEMARALLDSRRPFLWVIRENSEGEKKGDELCCVKELERQGMIVPWCSQVEVLSHPSVGCFVTHCGWNSTLESLASGVPVVAFPQWTDQNTNAKLVEDVWKTGVRVMVNQEGIVEGCEIKNCLELVMGGGERGQEMKRNAKKWKDSAREAKREGGSSDKNLKSFVDEIIKGLPAGDYYYV